MDSHAELHVRTPLWESRSIEALLGRQALLKMEAFQPSGSFKSRGMGAACRAAQQRGVTRVVCSSGGNAGLAVAIAGRQLGQQVTIVVPERTGSRARALIEREGADLVVHGDDWDASHVFAVGLAEREGAGYIHPFDDPTVWEGHATIIHEVHAAGVTPGVVVVSVGGGGLLAGLLQGMDSAGWRGVPVLAVETEGTASFYRSMEAGKLVTLEAITSIATTLGARTVCRQALNAALEHDVRPWLVSDRSAVQACLRFAEDHRVLVEPACGAALAAGYERAELLRGDGPVLFIVCGGAAVTPDLLERWSRDLGV